MSVEVGDPDGSKVHSVKIALCTLESDTSPRENWVVDSAAGHHRVSVKCEGTFPRVKSDSL